MRYILETEVDGEKSAVVVKTIPESIIMRLYREEDPEMTVVAEKVVL